MYFTCDRPVDFLHHVTGEIEAFDGRAFVAFELTGIGEGELDLLAVGER